MREMKMKRRRKRAILPPKGRRKKRAASKDPEVDASKRGKIYILDDSDPDAEVIPERRPRSKPLAAS